MIVVFGTVCTDRVRRVPFLPQPGGYVEIAEEHVFLGGEAANTANALVAWGDAVALACNPLGDGDEGDRLRARVASHRLTALELRDLQSTIPLPSPVCDVYVTPEGERTMFGRGFSHLEAHVSLEALPLSAGDWFTAEPNMKVASREAVRRAAAAGMRLYLMDFIRENDPVPSGSFWQSSTDWAGVRNDVGRNLQWVADFVGRTGAFTILSDGPNGFVFGGPELKPQHHPPFPAPAIVDATGAGDVFRAGMLHGLSRNWPIADCLPFAAAAGALKCAHLGATSSVPTHDAVARLMFSQA